MMENKRVSSEDTIANTSSGSTGVPSQTPLSNRGSETAPGPSSYLSATLAHAHHTSSKGAATAAIGSSHGSSTSVAVVSNPGSIPPISTSARDNSTSASTRSSVTGAVFSDKPSKSDRIASSAFTSADPLTTSIELHDTNPRPKTTLDAPAAHPSETSTNTPIGPPIASASVPGTSLPSYPTAGPSSTIDPLTASLDASTISAGQVTVPSIRSTLPVAEPSSTPAPSAEASGALPASSQAMNSAGIVAICATLVLCIGLGVYLLFLWRRNRRRKMVMKAINASKTPLCRKGSVASRLSRDAKALSEDGSDFDPLPTTLDIRASSGTYYFPLPPTNSEVQQEPNTSHDQAPSLSLLIPSHTLFRSTSRTSNSSRDRDSGPLPSSILLDPSVIPSGLWHFDWLGSERRRSLPPHGGEVSAPPPSYGEWV